MHSPLAPSPCTLTSFLQESNSLPECPWWVPPEANPSRHLLQWEAALLFALSETDFFAFFCTTLHAFLFNREFSSLFLVSFMESFGFILECGFRWGRRFRVVSKVFSAESGILARTKHHPMTGNCYPWTVKRRGCVSWGNSLQVIYPIGTVTVYLHDLIVFTIRFVFLVFEFPWTLQYIFLNKQTSNC